MSSYRDPHGRFKSGNPGGPGRPAKKIPAELYKKTLGLTESLISDVICNFDTLTPAQKIDVLTKLMPFVLPRLSAVDANFGLTVDELLTMPADERKAALQAYKQEYDEQD